MVGDNFGKFESIAQFLPIQIYTLQNCTNLIMILATASVRTPFCPVHDDLNQQLEFTESCVKDWLVKDWSVIYQQRKGEVIAICQIHKFTLSPDISPTIIFQYTCMMDQADASVQMIEMCSHIDFR